MRVQIVKCGTDGDVVHAKRLLSNLQIKLRPNKRKELDEDAQHVKRVRV